jgi:hypothetical protein
LSNAKVWFEPATVIPPLSLTPKIVNVPTVPFVCAITKFTQPVELLAKDEKLTPEGFDTFTAAPLITLEL